MYDSTPSYIGLARITVAQQSLALLPGFHREEPYSPKQTLLLAGP